MKKVREGYKITELGEIPEEWEVKRLIEVVDKSDRYSFTGGPFGSDLKSCHYTDSGVRVIQLQNIGDGNFINSNFTYTSELKANELMSCNIYCGDIIIAKMAEPVARACKIPDYEKRYLMCSDGIRLSVDKDNNDVDFIMYSINSNYFRKNAIANSTGSTRLRIGLSELKDLYIIIPKLKEQKKISLILSSVDEQIEITDNLIEKTKELKKGLMQKLLTKGIGHSRFKNTEIGRIPEEWEVKSLNEVSHKIGDGLHGTPIYDENGEYYFINGNNLCGGKIELANETKKVSQSEYNKYKKELTDNTVLISLNGTIGNLAYYNYEKVMLSKSTGYITLKDLVNRKYVFFTLSSNKVQLHFYKELTGTTIKNLSLETLRKTYIPIPDIKEQNQIASILSSVDEQIEQYESKKEKLQELKRGLMQKLLTGKIRVKY